MDAERRHSITFDNGTEFGRCQRLEKQFSGTLYFADPDCPYLRGTNENTNSLTVAIETRDRRGGKGLKSKQIGLKLHGVIYMRRAY